MSMYRKISYQDSPSRVKIGETISSTKKFQKDDTIHIRDCPNYIPATSNFNFFESRTHSEHHQFKRMKNESLRGIRNSKNRSGFEVLDHIINGASCESKGNFKATFAQLCSNISSNRHNLPIIVQNTLSNPTKNIYLLVFVKL